MKSKTIIAVLVITLICAFGFTTTAFADDEIAVGTEQGVETPSGVKAKAKSTSSIKVSWNEVEGANEYKVYVYSKAKGDYKLLKTTKSTSYTQKGLKAGKSKSYKVAAVDVIDGNKITSEMSDKASAKTKTTGAKKVMKKAKSKLGCAYVAGAAGSRAFDCSGFVWYVYHSTGAGKVKFSRSSAQGEYSQLKHYRVSGGIKNAKKGDIVFFSYSGSTSGICHVAIYAGNGKIIHAANPRKGVCTSSLSSYRACGQKVCAVVRIAK